MRSLLVLLTVLLAALPAHAVRYRVTPGGALGGVVATDWHAASDLADIRAGTATTVVNTAWLREAVTAACLTDTRTLYMPGGRYPMPAAAVASVGPPGGGGIGCDGLRIICSEGSQRGDGAIFYVTENRIGIQSTRDAMIYVNRANWFSIRGCAFAGQNFYGDGLRIEENAWVDVSDNYFANFKGSEYSEITSVNTGTDTLTKESSISSDNIVLGGRIEFEVYSGPTGGLPGGITIRTPYWVSFKSGHSFRISATPGGSDVNISSVGGKFYVLFDTITFDDTDLDLATDTFTMENHPFENGFKVEFSRSTAPTENGKAGTAFSTPLWVTNSTEDSFQLMDEPTGATIVDWVSDGGTNQKISASYAALRGGGNVYCTFNNNHISGRAIGVSILATENEAGAAPYGCNVYDFTNNHLNAGVRFDGAGNVHKNSFESALPYPLSAYLRIGGSASYSYVTGNYFEAQSKPVAAIGISFSGQNTGTAAIIRNYMFGGSATEVGTYGIDVGTANGAPILIGNHITSWANCVGATYSHNRLASSMFIGNTCGSTSVDGIQTPTEENQGAGRDPAFWQYSIAGFFAFLGGQVRMPVVTVDNATTLNLSEGNHWLLNGASNARIATLTGTGAGTNGVIRAVTRAVLGNSAFTTLSGADRQMAAGETIGYLGTDAGTRTTEKLGDIVNPFTTGSIAAEVAGATNLFSANVNAGTYEVCPTATVTSAATGGTFDVEIGWTDAVGATTRVVIDDMSLSATGRSNVGCTSMKTNGSSNVTYRIPFTGLTGTPALTVDLPIKRIQ